MLGKFVDIDMDSLLAETGSNGIVTPEAFPDWRDWKRLGRTHSRAWHVVCNPSSPSFQWELCTIGMARIQYH